MIQPTVKGLDTVLRMDCRETRTEQGSVWRLRQGSRPEMTVPGTRNSDCILKIEPEAQLWEVMYIDCM